MVLCKRNIAKIVMTGMKSGVIVATQIADAFLTRDNHAVAMPAIVQEAMIAPAFAKGLATCPTERFALPANTVLTEIAKAKLQVVALSPVLIVIATGQIFALLIGPMMAPAAPGIAKNGV